VLKRESEIGKQCRIERCNRSSFAREERVIQT
jgi:hypothetical protein